MNYKNTILSYKSYDNCNITIMCIINCITEIQSNCFSSDIYKLETITKYVVNAVILSVKFVHCV